MGCQLFNYYVYKQSNEYRTYFYQFDLISFFLIDMKWSLEALPMQTKVKISSQK